MFLHTAPGPPRNVQTLVLSSRTVVIVSWLPPEPRNGILQQYLVRVLIASTGQVVNSQIVRIGSTIEEQEMGRSVTFTGLDLDNFRYQIEVYASTSIGPGPSSIPVFEGMDTGNVITTTEAPPPTTSIEQPDTTSSAQASSTTHQIDSTTLTTLVTTSQPTAPQTSDVPPTVGVGETQPAPVRNDEYYIIRIVPPVIVALFIFVILIAVMLGFCCHKRVLKDKRRGLYSFDAPGDHYQMK